MWSDAVIRLTHVFAVLLSFLFYHRPELLLRTAEHRIACSSKALVVGHSFVWRLGTYLCHGEIGLQGHTVEFRGFPGSSMHTAIGFGVGSIEILHSLRRTWR